MNLSLILWYIILYSEIISKTKIIIRGSKKITYDSSPNKFLEKNLLKVIRKTYKKNNDKIEILNKLIITSKVFLLKLELFENITRIGVPMPNNRILDM